MSVEITTGWDRKALEKFYPRGLAVDHLMPQTLGILVRDINQIVRSYLVSNVHGLLDEQVGTDDYCFGESVSNKHDLEVKVEVAINQAWAAAYVMELAIRIADALRQYLNGIGLGPISVGCAIKFFDPGSVYVSRPASV